MPARPSNHTASKQPRWIGPHFTSKQNAQDVVRSAIERESSYESSDSEIELDAASDSEVSVSLSAVSSVGMTKNTLSQVAMLTEAAAAKVFNMGTTRFKAKCRDLGIDRWPHRKLQSLSNLYVDLKAHMDRCEKDSAKRHHYCNDMAVIKAYSIRLESDLSLLNQFYNGKKAWPDQILKIRQTIYKKRHAKVLSEKKKKLSHAGKQCQKGELPVVKCEASDSEVDVKQETNDSEDFSVDTKDSDDSLCVAMPECINDGALMMRSLESEGAHMVGDKDDNMFWAML